MKKCKYHDWMQTASHHDALVEVCKLCHEKKIWNIKDGRMDNEKYLEAHIRDFCQSTGSTAKAFEEIYGTDALNRSRAHKEKKETSTEQIIEDGKADVIDALKFWDKMSAKGYTDSEITHILCQKTQDVS